MVSFFLGARKYISFVVKQYHVMSDIVNDQKYFVDKLLGIYTLCDVKNKKYVFFHKKIPQSGGFFVYTL